MKANNARHLRLSKTRGLVHVAMYQGRGSKVTIFEQPNCEIAGHRAHLQLGYRARKGLRHSQIKERRGEPSLRQVLCVHKTNPPRILA